MENLDKRTPTELLKMGNDFKTKHEVLKQEIINDSFLIDDITKKINEKLKILDEIEKNYILIIEEINNRQS